LARLPSLGERIHVGEILDRPAAGALEIPEIARGDDVAGGPDMRLPNARAQSEAAAEDFVDVVHLEGQVVEMRARIGALQQEQLMVIGGGAAAQEDAALGITVR